MSPDFFYYTKIVLRLTSQRTSGDMTKYFRRDDFRATWLVSWYMIWRDYVSLFYRSSKRIPTWIPLYNTHWIVQSKQDTFASFLLPFLSTLAWGSKCLRSKYRCMRSVFFSTRCKTMVLLLSKQLHELEKACFIFLSSLESGHYLSEMYCFGLNCSATFFCNRAYWFLRSVISK